MTINVPPAVNYPSPQIAIPTRYGADPAEGPKIVPYEIDWGTMGGANSCVFCNLQNNATLDFSQILSIDVDNSASGADIQFLFPDTSTTVTVPAYTPKATFPVFTNQRQFYVLAVGAEPEDVSRFTLLNIVVPPIAIPVTQEQEAAVVNNIPITTSPGSQVLVPSGISGTVEALNISAQLTSTAGNSGLLTWDIEDGNSNVIAGGQVGTPIGTTTSQVAFENPNMRVRFVNGLKFKWTSLQLTAASAAAVNLYYRTP